ncbi:hypothetical protein [Nostoc sp.]|uniref:hypothetical protein n=1 Tax=Nostoc sp. TaxID=1180 RepID=UPI002FFA4E8F
MNSTTTYTYDANGDVISENINISSDQTKIPSPKKEKVKKLGFGLSTLVALSVIPISVVTMPLVLNQPVQALCIASRDFNGIWRSDDGGTYYVRQIGNEIWWLGMSADDGRTWTNVYKGTRIGDTVIGQWADVPRGGIRSGGVLNLSVPPGWNGSVPEFSRNYVTGGFGGSKWFKPCNDVILNPI